MAPKKCPIHGGKIFAYGISEKGKQAVLNAHNKYRLLIAQNKVLGQPRGFNLQRLYYEDQLGEEGHVVSDQCNTENIKIKDKRFNSVGQNLFKEVTSELSEENWDNAVDSWFNEKDDFKYPRTSTPGKHTNHYRQVVWAATEFLGCHFISYYDKIISSYVNLYTCNYGEGANDEEPPYSDSVGECDTLCL